MSFADMLGIVLIWRGIWNLLDRVDLWLFDGSHVSTSLTGVAIGATLLWLTPNDRGTTPGPKH